MKDIKCPSCGKTFKIDQSNFYQLLSQIKNDKFNKHIDERLNLAKKEFNLKKNNEQRKLIIIE